VIDWNLIECTLKDVFKSASEVDCVILENEPRPYTDDPFVTLMIKSPVMNGQDETRYECVENPGPAPEPIILPVLCGLRSFTVSAKVESECQTPLGDSSVMVASKIRTRLRKLDVQLMLRRAGLAIVTRMPTINLDAPKDERVVSISVLDVIFSVVDVENDDLIHNIENVDINGKFITPGGDEIDVDITVGKPVVDLLFAPFSNTVAIPFNLATFDSLSAVRFPSAGDAVAVKKPIGTPPTFDPANKGWFTTDAGLNNIIWLHTPSVEANSSGKASIVGVTGAVL
jgi:hypothetical protein